jgi:nitrogen fixation NifU-like protein
MANLRELYQETILDHNRNPRNFRRLEHPQCHADGRNPLCGDRISIDIALDGETIADIAFDGAGCAICTASASLMTQAIKGKTQAEAERLFAGFHEMLTGKWHTLQAALKREADPVSTE